MQAPHRREGTLTAILSTYYRPVIGGVETAAEHLARFLAERGRPVTVITKRTSPVHPARETLDGVDVQRTPPVGERRGSGKWLAIPWFIAALWTRRHALRLICCVDFRGIGIAALIGGALLGVPVVFETSTDGTISGESVRRRLGRLGLSTHGTVARAVTWPIRAIYRQAGLFVCVSRTLENELRASGVPPDRIKYFPHTVDRAIYHPLGEDQRRSARNLRGIAEGQALVLFVGRMSREKGVNELLDAWERLSPQDAVLVLVGPGMPGHQWDCSEMVERHAAQPHLRVRWVGHAAQEEVAAWMQIADLAVQPSHFEAFGIAAAEAMACGLPVVASDVGGFRDYVQDGVNGRRVPPRDAQALADAMGSLLLDRDLRSRLSLGAIATAERFDEERVLTDLMVTLESLA